MLWGSWLGSEVIIGADPMVTLTGLDAGDCWEPLSIFPGVTGMAVGIGDGIDGIGGGIGGGWFTVLGYDPGTSWLAFCDSLLRRRVDGSWVFESLGLMGRQEARNAALARARTAVGSKVPPPPTSAGIGPLWPVADEGVADEAVAHEGVAAERVADDHLAGVERVIGRIRVGEVYQLNLCTRLAADLLESPLQLFVRTAGALRPAYGAHLPTGPQHTGPQQTGPEQTAPEQTGPQQTGPEQTVISMSPERFLTVRNGTVITSPIKGTTKRSEDPTGDLLRTSTKDAAENVMITDLMRNDLSRVCAPGSVAVTDLLQLQSHPGVWHLVSTVTGRLPPEATVADLLAATFPPGSVTGAPKSSAVRAIGVEEPHPRGAYTGAAGLITADDRAELSVLIRTFEANGSRVELGVGGGITVDSVPVREWRECLHKAEPLAVAAGSRLVHGLDEQPPMLAELRAHGVFESILVQHGRPLRLADHLARLARSVRELYAADLPDDLTTRIADLVVGSGEPRAALRVMARPTATGLDVDVGLRALGPRPESCTLVRAERASHSWRHKWADRTDLQHTEERAAPALPYFCDPHGRVAETSRGNLFVQGANGIWRTPPSGDHQLPGVTRRALLDELGDHSVAVEITPISVQDLATARSVVWTSSLSGAVAVEAIDDRNLDDDKTAATWSRWLGVV